MDRLDQIQFVVALLTSTGIIVFLGSSVPYWNQVLVYALGERQSRQHRQAAKGEVEKAHSST